LFSTFSVDNFVEKLQKRLWVPYAFNDGIGLAIFWTVANNISISTSYII